jgi:diguanylate cyclase (GGDEF)-like protein/putative nucleotidyltransferase with HDIG domain
MWHRGNSTPSAARWGQRHRPDATPSRDAPGVVREPTAGVLAARATATLRTLRRRPLLLGLVYGVFLVLVAITATAQAIVATTHFSAQTLNATVARDRTLVRIFVDGNLQPSDLSTAGDAERVALLQRQLAAYVDRGEILRVEVRSLDSRVLLSNDSSIRGSIAPTSAGFDRALTAQISAEIVSGRGSHAGGASLPTDAVLEEFVPLVAVNGDVQAVFGIWRDAQPILLALAGIRNDSILVTLGAAAVLALILFITFHAANTRIARQTTELVEATRRDPLTGLLNHGALVAALAASVDEARQASGTVGIALADIDGFRLVNDTYGHAAGDVALLAVAERLRRVAPVGSTIGRYGPDEFLLLMPGESKDVAAVIEVLRTDMSAAALEFDGSERLPISLSAGICSYPDHAAAVTELLATATFALREAKSSGGDRVVAASLQAGERQRAGGFDVLQGLVIAIDTKDRYTQRHSEDVARYAVFIADQLGLDSGERRAIETAGLLHDVGKIGIPDEVLRKPGTLTNSEYEVMKQHAKLGDMIVRDLPNIEVIRAGIRHHHEGWDGGGYPDGLSGEVIPLAARILAVADAFSAMTTTRPYRKALSAKEGVRRLMDAAGTQLEPRLVTAFVTGLESSKDPPLPGSANPARLWLPSAEVA